MIPFRVLFLCLSSSLLLSSLHAVSLNPEQSVILRILDKFTNEKKEIQLPLNKPIKEGTLTITAKCCFSAPPEDPPEHTAFIEIIEEKTVDSSDTPSSIPELSYQNWMFSSGPSINPFEHTQYYVSVVHCVNNSQILKD
jgi:hypothetical protein